MEGASDHWTKQLLSQERILEQSALPLAPGSDSSLRAHLLCKGKHQVSSPNLTVWFLFDHQTDAPPTKRKCILRILLTVGLTAAHSQACFSCCVSSIVVCMVKCRCYRAITHRLLYRWVLLCVEEVAYIGNLPLIQFSVIYQYSFISTTGYLMHYYAQYKTWSLPSRLVRQRHITLVITHYDVVIYNTETSVVFWMV